MKTKSLIIYLNFIDNILGKIVDENSTKREININLYKFNVYIELLMVLLTHWKNINISYSYDEVSVNVSNNMLHILNQTEEQLRLNTKKHYRTFREYWDIIRRDLKNASVA